MLELVKMVEAKGHKAKRESLLPAKSTRKKHQRTEINGSSLEREVEEFWNRAKPSCIQTRSDTKAAIQSLRNEQPGRRTVGSSLHQESTIFRRALGRRGGGGDVRLAASLDSPPSTCSGGGYIGERDVRTTQSIASILSAETHVPSSLTSKTVRREMSFQDMHLNSQRAYQGLSVFRQTAELHSSPPGPLASLAGGSQRDQQVLLSPSRCVSRTLLQRITGERFPITRASAASSLLFPAQSRDGKAGLLSKVEDSWNVHRFSKGALSSPYLTEVDVDETGTSSSSEVTSTSEIEELEEARHADGPLSYSLSNLDDLFDGGFSDNNSDSSVYSSTSARSSRVKGDESAAPIQPEYQQVCRSVFLDDDEIPVSTPGT